MGNLLSLLIFFSCNLNVKIATPPMYKTDSTLTAFAILDGGTPPYTYAWNNGGTKDSSVYSNSSWIVVCNVQDVNGCIAHGELIIE